MPTTLERPDLRETPVLEPDVRVEPRPPVELPEVEEPRREKVAPKKPVRWMRWMLAVVAIVAVAVGAGLTFVAFTGDGDEVATDTSLTEGLLTQAPAYGDYLAEFAAPATPAVVHEPLIAHALRLEAESAAVLVPEPISSTFIPGRGSPGVQTIDRTFISGTGPDVPQPISSTFIPGPGLSADAPDPIDAPEPISSTFIPGRGSQAPDPIETTFIGGMGSDVPEPISSTFIAGGEFPVVTATLPTSALIHGDYLGDFDTAFSTVLALPTPELAYSGYLAEFE